MMEVTMSPLEALGAFTALYLGTEAHCGGLRHQELNVFLSTAILSSSLSSWVTATVVLTLRGDASPARWCLQLLRGLRLQLVAQVLDLGLPEDDVGVSVRALFLKMEGKALPHLLIKKRMLSF
jgi:hypothetical protein